MRLFATRLTAIAATLRRAWSPSYLFAASEPGAWYDPSDMSTLFQDSAGTTPVTAVEQPVGRILDKSGRGKHATRATTTKRPVLSARVNLYPNSTFTGGVSGNPGTAPSGLTYFADANTTFTYSADTVRIETPAGYRAQVGASYAAAANTEYRFRAKVNVRAATALWQHFTLQGPAGTTLRFFVDGVEVPGASTLPTGIHDLECRAALGVNAGAVLVRSGNGTQSTVAFACDIEFTQPSITLANDARIPYQRVNTATDYDTDPAKFPAFRRLDGVDDSLACATGGGGSAGFFFSSVISPLGSAGTNRVLFSDAGDNTGYLERLHDNTGYIVRLNASNKLEMSAGNGKAYTTIATAGALVVGATDVVQAWDDGTNLNVKIGSGPTASIARPVVSAGTAGYTLYQDNDASTGYFNGRSYGEIYRKNSGLTQSQREAVAVYQRTQARIA